MFWFSSNKNMRRPRHDATKGQYPCSWETKLLSKNTKALFIVELLPRAHSCFESEPPLKVSLPSKIGIFSMTRVSTMERSSERVLTDRRRWACLDLMNLLHLLQLIQLGLLTRNKNSQLFQIFHGSTRLQCNKEESHTKCDETHRCRFQLI